MSVSLETQDFLGLTAHEWFAEMVSRMAPSAEPSPNALPAPTLKGEVCGDERFHTCFKARPQGTARDSGAFGSQP